MRKIRILLSIWLGITALSLGSLPVYAQTSNTSGASNASDFQPTTGNPQNNVGSGLQTTTSGLQPVPGSQAGLTQDSLRGGSDLHVAGTTGAPNLNTTSTPSNKPPKKSINWLPEIIVGLLTIGGIIYVVAQPSNDRRKKAKQTAVTAKAAKEPEPEPLPTAKKTKKKSTKRPANRRAKKRRK